MKLNETPDIINKKKQFTMQMSNIKKERKLNKTVY